MVIRLWSTRLDPVQAPRTQESCSVCPVRDIARDLDPSIFGSGIHDLGLEGICALRRGFETKVYMSALFHYVDVDHTLSSSNVADESSRMPGVGCPPPPLIRPILRCVSARDASRNGTLSLRLEPHTSVASMHVRRRVLSRKVLENAWRATSRPTEVLFSNSSRRASRNLLDLYGTRQCFVGRSRGSHPRVHATGLDQIVWRTCDRYEHVNHSLCDTLRR